VVFGVERTVLGTFNQPLFEAQQKTLRREIRKRKQRLTAVTVMLERHRKSLRGKRPTVEGVQKKVQAILTGRHMKDLFEAKVTSHPGGLPRLSWNFREESWKKLQATLLGKTILFTDRDDWPDEEIVKAYRSQYHVEAAFRKMKNPRFLSFRPTCHWTDQKLRVHAFYCVLALMILSLLRRQLAQGGLPLSITAMMEKLSEIQEVTVLYPAPPEAKGPFARTLLSETDDIQRRMIDLLDLHRYRSETTK
jgi:transposase